MEKPAGKTLVCPHCLAPIHNRRRGYCTTCRQELPANLQLTNKQRRFLDQQEQNMRKRAEDFQLPDVSSPSY